MSLSRLFTRSLRLTPQSCTPSLLTSCLRRPLSLSAPLPSSQTLLSSRTHSPSSHVCGPACSSHSRPSPSSTSSPIGAGFTLSELGKRGTKVRSSIKLMCDGCQFVKRKGYLRVVCSKDAKHKQRQGWVKTKGRARHN